MYIIGIELPVLSMCNEASYLRRPVIILEKKTDFQQSLNHIWGN